MVRKYKINNEENSSTYIKIIQNPRKRPVAKFHPISILRVSHIELHREKADKIEEGVWNREQ